jgi:hypothetical protein
LELFVMGSLVNPMLSRKLVGTLQRVTMEQRAEERVKSKRLCVMHYIEVQNLPQSERMLTYSMVSYCMNGGIACELKNFNYTAR